MVRRWTAVCLFLSVFSWTGTALANDIFKLSYTISGGKQLTGEEVFPDSVSRDRFIHELVIGLQREGFPFSQVVQKDAHGPLSVHVSIQTGTRFEWLELAQGNLDELLHVKSGLDLRRFRGVPLDYTSLQLFFDTVLNDSENQGYPFASIGLDSIRLDGQQIKASIAYESGPRITFDTLKITGNSLTRPFFLAKLTNLVPGEPFSQEKVDRSIGILKNLPYLRVVGEPSISFQNEEATVYFPLDDRRINSLDGIIGLLPNEIENNKLLVTGQFDLALYNVSGKGRDYQVAWQRLSQYSQNLRLMATEPLVLGSGLDVKGSFTLLKEDTTFLNRDFKVDVGYRLSSSVYLGFFSRRQTGDLLSTEKFSMAEELPEVADFRFNNYGMNISFNTVDDIFFPKRGILSSFTFGLGNKRILQNTGLDQRLYSGLDLHTFQHYFQAGMTYHHLWKRQLGTVLAVQAGQTANQNLLLNDLFRLGGLKSIRGFNENHFFASSYAYITLEPRFYFDTSSYFLTFVDAGAVDNSVTEAEREFPYSFGGGFSMQTKGGIFKFVYALGKSASQPLSFNYSRIHFGFTGRF